MGAVRLEKARAQLAGRIALEVLWRPFEIHPEVPPAGLPLSSIGYEPAELAAMMEHLRRQAAAEGMDFAPRSPESLLVNTHRALAASVYAHNNEPERSEAFHNAVFRANFCESLNIGDPAVLRELAAAAGLDVARMDAALETGAADDALRDAAADAHRRNITAVPAFVFGGSCVVVGAHPPAALVQAAERAVVPR
ncbi:MAG: DsbA family protein [Legionella sp.]|nr:DsbA family protein [Legionella sp.]